METLLYLIVIGAIIYFFVKKMGHKNESNETQPAASATAPQNDQQNSTKGTTNTSKKKWVDPLSKWNYNNDWAFTDNPIQSLIDKAKGGDFVSCYQLYRIFTDKEYWGGQYSQYYNPEKAFPFLKKAAELGHAEAQFDMFMDYYSHPKYDQKITAEEAKHWLLASADLGYDRAQGLLGLVYKYGDEELGIEKDLEKARMWLQSSIDLKGDYREESIEALRKLEVESSLDNIEL